MSAQDTGLYQLIELFLKQFSSKDKVDGLPREIPNRQLQRYINSRVSAEEIPRPTPKEVNEAMAQLGYSERWDESTSKWVR